MDDVALIECLRTKFRRYVDLRHDGITESQTQKQEEAVLGILAKLYQDDGVAYLADEVGMGKTYIALTTIFMFWQLYGKDKRVLVIAPRENVQREWVQTYHQMMVCNVQPDSHAVRTPYINEPIHPVWKVDNIPSLMASLSSDENPFVVARMPSFSCMLAGHRKKNSGLKKEFVFSYKDRSNANAEKSFEICFPDEKDPEDLETVKDIAKKFQQLVSHTFDLIVIDESHLLHNRESGNQRVEVLPRILNLIHRNMVADKYPKKRPKVLMMSATPMIRHIDDLKQQLAFVLPIEKLNQEGMNCTKYLIRRLRLFENSEAKLLSKYDYRLFNTLKCPLNLQTTLLFALMQKNLLQDSSTHKRKRINWNLLDSLESFNETETDEGFENEKKNASPDRILLQQIRNELKDIQFVSMFPHPKQDEIINKVTEGWGDENHIHYEKHLIFVSRRATTKELVRKISLIYDTKVFPMYCRNLFPKVPDKINLCDDWVQYLNQALSSSTNDIDEEMEFHQDEPNTDPESMVTLHSKFFKAFTFKTDVNEKTQLNRLRSKFTKNQKYSIFFEENFLRLWLNLVLEKSIHSQQEELFLAFIEKLLHHDDFRTLFYKVESSKKQDRFYLYQRIALQWILKNCVKVRHILFDLITVEIDQKRELLQWMIQRLTTLNRIFVLKKPTIEESVSPELIRETLQHQSFWDILNSEKAPTELREWFFPIHLSNADVATFEERQQDQEIFQKVLLQGEGILLITAALIYTKQNSSSELTPIHYLSELFVGSTLGRRLLNRFRDYRSIRKSICNMIFSPENSSKDSNPLKCFEEQSPASFAMRGADSKHLQKRFNSPFFPDIIICTKVFQEGVNLHLSCNNVWHYGTPQSSSVLEQRIGRVDRYMSKVARICKRTSDPKEYTQALHTWSPYISGTVDEKLVANGLLNFIRIQQKLDYAQVLQKQQVSPDVFEMSLQNIVTLLNGNRNKDVQSASTPYPINTTEIQSWWESIPRSGSSNVVGPDVAWSLLHQIAKTVHSGDQNLYTQRQKFVLICNVKQEERDQPVKLQIRYNRKHQALVLEVSSLTGWSNKNIRSNIDKIETYLTHKSYTLRTNYEYYGQPWEIVCEIQHSNFDTENPLDLSWLSQETEIVDQIRNFATLIDDIEYKERNKADLPFINVLPVKND